MFKNYWKTAFRNITKHKFFSLIKITSLAIGLSASFVIGLMAYYDLSFDKFHPNRDRIHRITTEFTTPDGKFYNSGVTVALGTDLKEGLPGLETVAPLFLTYPLYVKNLENEKVFKKPKYVVYADEGYFNLFKYRWLAGSNENVLQNPNELVLTEKRAKMYFPDKDLSEIVGSTLIYQDTIPTKITGIVANWENRTDLVFEEFISLKTADNSDMTNLLKYSGWNSTSSASQLFVGIAENASSKTIQSELDKIAEKQADAEMKSYGQTRKFYMQPIADLHFDPNYNTFDFNSSRASKSVLLSLGCIGLFLLLLGCVNFINLNTAQATQRAKEIGIRKTLGSSKKQLVYQFLGETFLLTLAAALLSLFLAFGLIRAFSDFLPAGLDFELFSDPFLILFMILTLVVVTFLSGFYPGMVLSNFRPISVLKNQGQAKGNKSLLRKYLTVFQFVIAQVFIIGTVLVGKQLNFLMTKDMGIKTEAVANIQTPWHYESMEKRMLFMNEIKAQPLVTGVSLSSHPPASFSSNSSHVTYYADDKEINTELLFLYGDRNYLNLYDIALLAGRQQLNDTIREFVINEAYVKRLGFKNPQDALGKMLKINDESYPIVGVMENFNQRSLKSDIEPMAFAGDWYRERFTRFNTVHFSLNTGQSPNWSETLAQIEKSWNNIYPEADFKVQFMDDMVQRFYEQERRTSTLLQWATSLAILISCLGLLGLVVYTTERRTKEIGIRKVLGASLTQLNVLLCKEFLILVGIAFLIAAPIAWYGLHNWLQDFAYKTKMSWWVFALSGMIMGIISLIIMSIRTIAKANTNPVKSLRTE
ncbi:ABC transporter permease [Pareuzebyella sediminis]|uniref:ABC transporter permease n=1 Tax=Pareuzebyella sediminis TaxID=2607998 RepID=UPI0011ED9164|nr:ABC transporter permease [Pareuzebyella sediminis]